MREAGAGARDIAAVGIANQRETTLLWHRGTGRPVHRAIVWQDRRTADVCARLKDAGREPLFTAKTGLLLDPYFSGTKLAWLLQQDAGAARAPRAANSPSARSTRICCGGSPAARCTPPTQRTRRARCCSISISGRWDGELLALLGIPAAVLPRVLRFRRPPSASPTPELFGAAIPICGIAGDQQAALIGQACFAPGMIKSTYGTGCFALLNTGATAGRVEQQATDDHRLSARRRTLLCAGRLDLRRRRCGAMAARRHRHRAKRR